MSSIVHRQLAVAPRRRSPRDWCGRLTQLARLWRERRRQYRELCDYLAKDHRAAADIGITSCEATHLLRQPFWRP